MHKEIDITLFFLDNMRYNNNQKFFSEFIREGLYA